MTEHGKGTFTVSSWDENTYEELGGGAKLTRARMTFEYSGDLQGQGVSEALMCYRADGTAVYTGLERMVGQVAGRPGSYVLRADGTYDGAEARTAWQVVEGSGTGELAGLRGSGLAVSTSAPPGTFSFDYELG